MRRSPGIAAAVFAALAALNPASDARACECAWRGPFLTMAPQSELIVRVKVLGYFGEERGRPQAMDLDVLEVLCGEPPTSPLRVWGDNGMLCRPYVSQFPLGTEWILALNGPGSKPGMSPGPSISMCGQFWLEMKNGEVVGAIDVEDMNAHQQSDLAALRTRLAMALIPADGARRQQIKFGGEIKEGGIFERAFGPGLVFRLEPVPLGWTVTVREKGRSEDLARLTPPLHFAPNPREIEGWNLRNADNTGPNETGSKNVNAPGEEREFIFSQEVGRTIDGPGSTGAPTPEDIEKVRGFGRGLLKILDHRLNKLDPGAQAGFERMRFEVVLSWPAPQRLGPGISCRRSAHGS